MKKRFNIVLLGQPGSGKGAQTELLVKNYNLRRISIGDILRLEVKRKTNIGRKIEYAMDNGSLVDSRLVMMLAKKHIGKEKYGIVFDGFPRDLYEAKALDKIMNITHMFFIDVPQKVIIKRLGNRYECYCGMTYNLISKKPKHDLTCDICGRKLYRRVDDEPKAIKRRISIYKRETLPVVTHYKDKVMRINGSRSIEGVFKIIKKRLE